MNQQQTNETETAPVAEPTSAFRMSEKVTGLFPAFIAAQAEIGNAIKDSENPHFNRKYADLSSVWAAFTDAFAKNGLAVIQGPIIDGNHVRVVTRVIHKSGEWMESEVEAVAVNVSPQAIGSVITYLRRYGASSLIGVVQGDDDGNAGQGDNPQRQSTRPRTHQAPQQQRSAPAPAAAPKASAPVEAPFDENDVPPLADDETLGSAFAGYIGRLMRKYGHTGESIRAALQANADTYGLTEGIENPGHWPASIAGTLIEIAKTPGPNAFAVADTVAAKPMTNTEKAKAVLAAAERKAGVGSKQAA